MAKCRITYKKDGSVKQVYAANGNPSILWKDLKSQYSDAKAYNIYISTLTPTFKNLFSGLVDLDQNKEPRIYYSNDREINLFSGTDSSVEHILDLQSNEEEGAFSTNMPHHELELIDLYEETTKFKSMVPLNSNNQPIFPITYVERLLIKTDGELIGDEGAYGYFKKTGEILLSTEAERGTLYHEAFHGIVRKLLSSTEQSQLYNEVRGLKGKAETYKNEIKSFSKFTDKEADEWLAEEFREYTLNEGDYIIGKGVPSKSLMGRIFDFIYKLFNNLDANKALFKKIHTGYYNRPISEFTTYDIKTEAAKNAPKISARFKKNMVDNMEIALFDIASKHYNIDFSKFYERDTSELYKQIKSIYGGPKTVDNVNTVYQNIFANMEDKYFDLEDRIEYYDSKVILTENQKIRYKNLLVAQDRIDKNLDLLENKKVWNDLVKQSIVALSRHKFNLNHERLQEEMEETAIDENDNEVSKDTFHIRSSNQINPTTYLKPEIQLFINTLPQATRDKNGKLVYKERKNGTIKKADPSIIRTTLYAKLANKKNREDMAFTLNEMAKEDATYYVLAQRLNIIDPVSKEISLDQMYSLDFNKQTLVNSFFIAFNQAKDEYNTLVIKKDGGRVMTNSNKDQVIDRTKTKWKTNFRNQLNRGLGSENTETGLFTLNVNQKISILGRPNTLKNWLIKPNFMETMTLLKLLGMEFSNEVKVVNILRESPLRSMEFMNATGRLFETMVKSENMYDIFDDTDHYGDMKILFQLEDETSLTTTSLHHLNAENEKVYGVTLKHIMNLWADEWNSPNSEMELERLLQHPNLHGSVWLQLMQKGEKFSWKNLEGSREEHSYKGRKLSKANKANIALSHWNAILEGYVPLLRPGNKSQERAPRVGSDPTYTTIPDAVIAQIREYLRSEIVTASIIHNNGVGHPISELDQHGSSLQWGNHPDFKDLHDLIEGSQLIVGEPLDLKNEQLENILQNPKVTENIKTFLANRSEKNLESLVEKGIFIESTNARTGKKGYRNIGLDETLVKKAYNAIPNVVERGILFNNAVVLDDAIIEHLLQQLTFIETIGRIEQTKVLFKNMHLYSDPFKRFSLFTGTKKYPHSDTEITDWLNTNMPNTNKIPHSNTVRTITRQEIIHDSKYLLEYQTILNHMGREDLIPALDEVYKGMKVFDGGGFLTLDFYRAVRWRTDSWNTPEEVVYQKIINNEEITSEEIGLLTPMKPQVVAPFIHNDLQLIFGNKFALYPIHPNLSKTVQKKRTGMVTVMDDIWNEMVNNNIHYQTFTSGTKFGAVRNQYGEFDQLINFERSKQHVPLFDDSAVIEFDIKYFGVQIDPTNKRNSKVPQGTQKNAMLFMDVFDRGELSTKYENSEFIRVVNGQEINEGSWERAHNEYQNLHKSLIKKDLSNLASNLGATITSKGFELLNNTESLDIISETIIDELDKREIKTHTKTSIKKLFKDAKDNNNNALFLDQLYEKIPMETVLLSTMTNSVIRRKMRGEQHVLQADIGFETTDDVIKQKDNEWFQNLTSQDKKNLGLQELKFYRKEIEPLENESQAEYISRLAAAPTKAMQVYLPHHYKQFFGKELPNDINISLDARQIVGFRVPTEGLGSLEFIEIVGFLPPSAGNNIIVPSEMVAKSGADYDIDKLTLYFPNTKYNKDTNTIELVESITSIEQLRIEDPISYIAAAAELFKNSIEPAGIISFTNKFNNTVSNKKLAEKLLYTAELADSRWRRELFELETEQDIAKDLKNDIEVNRLEYEIEQLYTKIISFAFQLDNSDAYTTPQLQELLKDTKSKLENLDDELLLLGYDNLSLDMKQSKQVLENELQSFIKTLLSHPLSFEDLITPVGAFELRDLATEIRDRKLNKGTIKASPIDSKNMPIADKFSTDNIIEASYQMWSTLGGTGVGATAQTSHSKIQNSNLVILPQTTDEEGNSMINPNRINFEGFNSNDPVSLSSKYTLEGIPSSKAIKQYITGYVDGEKNPFVTYINAGLNGASTHMFLNRIGLPLKTVIYFMSQPIITDYFEQVQLLQSDHRKSRDINFLAKDIKNKILLKYKPKQNLREEQQLNSDLLNEMVDLTIEEMNDFQKAVQVQILEDFFRYKHMANHLRNLQQLTSQDTVKLKSTSEFIYFKALREHVLEQNIFNVEAVTEIMNKTFLSELQKLYSSAEEFFSNFDTKFSHRDIINRFTAETKNLIEKGKSKDEILNFLGAFSNYLSAYLMLEVNSKNKTFNQDAKRLFQGPKSLADRILAIKPNTDNLFIEELSILKQAQTDPKSHSFTIDEISLYGNRYTTDELDALADGFNILYEENPQLAEDILIYSMIKSGVSYSPKSFSQALPGDKVLDLLQPVFRVVKDIVANKNRSLDRHSLDLNDIFRKFLNNSWGNPRVIQSRTPNSRKFPGIKIYRKENEDRLTIRIPKKERQDGIYQHTEYFKYFYEQEIGSNARPIRTSKKGIKTYPYTLSSLKLGLPGALIETGNKSIIPSNRAQLEETIIPLPKAVQKKIWMEDKKLISSAEFKKLSSGAIYRLPDYNQRVQFNMVGEFTNQNIKNNSKNRVDLGIPSKVAKPLTALANLLGFESTSAMAKTKNYTKFVKSRNFKLGFYKIILMPDAEVESETITTTFDDISPEIEDKALNPTEITEEATTIIGNKINKQKDEC